MLQISSIVQLAAQWKWAIVSLVVSIFLGTLVQRRYRTGLNKIPGPVLASILPFDRILTSLSGKQFLAHIKYHEEYGPLVRVGPNHISFSDADVITQLYGITTKFYKVCRANRNLGYPADDFLERLLYPFRRERESWSWQYSYSILDTR